MTDPGTYTIVEKIPMAWTEEICTGQLRFVARQTAFVLQQQWEIRCYDDPKFVSRRVEWRDVPVVNEALDDGLSDGGMV